MKTSSRPRQTLRRLELAFRFLVLVLAAIGVVRQVRQLRKELRRADEVRDRQLADPSLKTQPPVSVLTGAWNPDEDLNAFVAAFQGIEYPNKELILAIGGAHRRQDYDHLAGPGVTLIDNPGGGKNAALMQCLPRSSGEILVVFDADSVPTSSAFLHLIAPLVNGDYVASTGVTVPHQHLRHHTLVQLQWASRAHDAGLSRAERTRLRGACWAITRAAMDEAGGLPAEALSDDYYLGRRLRQNDHAIAFAPGCVIETNQYAEPGAYIRQRSRWAKNVPNDSLLLGRLGDAARGFLGSLADLALILITLSLPITRWRGVFLLLLPLLRSYLIRWRCLLFAQRLGLFPVEPRHYLANLAHIYLDMAGSVLALFEYPFQQRRRRW